MNLLIFFVGEEEKKYYLISPTIYSYSTRYYCTMCSMHLTAKYMEQWQETVYDNDNPVIYIQCIVQSFPQLPILRL